MGRNGHTRQFYLVDWLVAVQFQDFAGAKWALAQRLESFTDERIEVAFNDGRIVRTHLLRPTWHFTTPADICWLLTLTTPRVHITNAHYGGDLTHPLKFQSLQSVWGNFWASDSNQR